METSIHRQKSTQSAATNKDHHFLSITFATCLASQKGLLKQPKANAHKGAACEFLTPPLQLCKAESVHKNISVSPQMIPSFIHHMNLFFFFLTRFGGIYICIYKIKSHEQVFRTEILVTYETQVTAHLHKNHKSYGLTEQCPIYYNPAYSLFPDRWVCSTLASSWRTRCQKDKRYLFTKAQKQFFHLLTVTSENLLKAPLKVMCLHSQATERTELSPQTPAHENVSLKIPTCHSNADKLISTGD